MHNFSLRFPYNSWCFLLHNLLLRSHAFETATRFPFEISCFLALLRFHDISSWVFILFDPNEISFFSWDFMLFSCMIFLCNFLVRCHVLFRCKIGLWDFILFGCYEMCLWDFMHICLMRFHAFCPLWDCTVLQCIFVWDFLFKSYAFCLWDFKKCLVLPLLSHNRTMYFDT